MENFNRPLPYTTISSCLNQYETVYLASEPNPEEVAKGKTQTVAFLAENILSWMASTEANSFKVEFGVYTEDFVSEIEALFPDEPEVAASIQVDRLTAFIVAYNLYNEPIEAYNFGDIRP